ncbi:FMN-binding protein [Wansuia hejianensis]|uniref:Ion-translocating oxidoreductase complex subunit G n=1 Tax=Wansuia hejianensis TaxID=2763667 RepID=A0A926EXX2_9FIRM|nr:FMN-binding protein [Wansuia hejianensis]MBC8589596.1 FMN-binding protein [Wansuia hejianensis]
MKKKSIIYPIFFMAIITAFFTFILAFLDYSTAEKVANLQENELRQKIVYVFDLDIPLDDPEKVDRAFRENIEEETINGKTIFTLKENGKVKGYAFPVGGPGLWGSVEGFVGISADYTTLLGIDFTSHSETPGLGGRISEEEFKGQFRGLDLTEVKDKEYIIYKPATGGNVDAITGATLTSKSVSDFLNNDIAEFIREREGSK